MATAAGDDGAANGARRRGRRSVLEAPQTRSGDAVGDIVEAGPRAFSSRWPGWAVSGSWRVPEMMESESDRSRAVPLGVRPAAPGGSGGRRRGKCDRKVSVSTAASMASLNAGRKFTACWLPFRASCSVSRSASSLPDRLGVEQVDGSLAERVAVVERGVGPAGQEADRQRGRRRRRRTPGPVPSATEADPGEGQQACSDHTVRTGADGRGMLTVARESLRDGGR